MPLPKGDIPIPTMTKPWTVFSVGAEKSFGKLSVTATFTFDQLKSEIENINTIAPFKFDQAFPPIGLSFSWEL